MTTLDHKIKNPTQPLGADIDILLETTPKLYKIGELAKLTNKSVRALRLYEEKGLLFPTERSSGQFRLYDEHAIERVQWIGKLQHLELSLSQIRDLVRIDSPNQVENMNQVRDFFVTKLQNIHQRVQKLQELEKDLLDALAYLSNCRSCSDTKPACHACGHQVNSAPTLINELVDIKHKLGKSAQQQVDTTKPNLIEEGL